MNTLFWLLPKLFSDGIAQPSWQGLPTWKAILSGLSGVAGFTGVFCVFMVGKGKLSNYLWGALNALLYGAFAFSVGYTGDAILNIFYFLPIQFIGFFMWKENTKNEVVKANKLKVKDLVVFSIITAILFGGFWLLIPAMDNELHKFVLKDSDYDYAFRYDYLPRIFDTLTNTFSIVAQLLMIKRYKEQWYLWIVINVLQISMYAGVNGWGLNIPMILMWGVFLVNAIYSLINWIKMEKNG